MKIIIFFKKLWLKISKKKLVKDSASITIWNVLGKAVGFLVPFFIAAWFGVTSETDAFFFTYGIFIFISGVFAISLERTVVPFISEAKFKSEDIDKFIGSIFVISTIALVLISGILSLFFKPLLLLVTNFDRNSIDLTFNFFLLGIFLIVFSCWTSILSGLLNSYKKFIVPALSPMFRAAINLIFIFIFKSTLGIYAVIAGFVIGEFFRFTILLIYAYKTKISRIKLCFISRKTASFLKVSSYQIMGASIVGLNPVIGRTMASWLQKGSVSILEYANRLYEIPTTFIITGVLVVLLSYWSDDFYNYGKHKLKNDVIRAIKILSIISLIITVALILLNKQIINIAYARGEFDLKNIPEVAKVFVFFMFGFISFTISRLFVQTHIVLKNTKILLVNGIINTVLTILLNYIFIKYFNVAGIALTTTVISTFSVFFLGFYFFKKVKRAA
jgi:putative peptidoglycan lipid II flippase